MAGTATASPTAYHRSSGSLNARPQNHRMPSASAPATGATVNSETEKPSGGWAWVKIATR